MDDRPVIVLWEVYTVLQSMMSPPPPQRAEVEGTKGRQKATNRLGQRARQKYNLMHFQSN